MAQLYDTTVPDCPPGQKYKITKKDLDCFVESLARQSLLPGNLFWRLLKLRHLDRM